MQGSFGVPARELKLISKSNADQFLGLKAPENPSRLKMVCRPLISALAQTPIPRPVNPAADLTKLTMRGEVAK